MRATKIGRKAAETERRPPYGTKRKHTELPVLPQERRDVGKRIGIGFGLGKRQRLQRRLRLRKRP